MKSLLAFGRLSGQDRILLVEAFAMLAGCRLALRFVPLERLLANIGERGRRKAPLDRVAWALRAASRRMPRVTCLETALALQRLLARYGHSSSLRIGVAKTGPDFSAHAWLIGDDRVLIGDENLEKYTELTSWNAGAASGAASAANRTVKFGPG